MISRSLEIPSPIAPMKLKKIKSPEDMLKKYKKQDLIIQQKFDGFKSQIIKTNKTKIYTRRGEDFSENIPDFLKELDAKLKNNSFILGELVWEDNNGKQSISDIQTVVSSTPENAAKKLKEKSGRIIFYAYDLLWQDGKKLTEQNYIDRYNKLKSHGETKNFKIVKNYSFEDLNSAIKDTLKSGGEGIVIKPKSSKYEYNRLGETEKIGEWAKFKPGAKANTDEVIVNKYEKDKEKLIFPAYQYKGKELFEVGKVSGLSKEEEKEVKDLIDKGEMVILEITFQEKMPSGKFRHIGFNRIRKDKPLKEVRAKILSKRAYKKFSIRENFVDDEPHKYEKEKDDPKWNEVLIDDDGKWTRLEIRNHYIKNADKILKEIKRQTSNDLYWRR